MAVKRIIKTYKLKSKDPNFYDTCKPYTLTLNPGKYKFDCFGGSSAESSISSLNGYGAHVSGIITLLRQKTFYIYVGGQGSPNYLNQKEKISYGGYNGGGNGGYGAYSPGRGIYVYSGSSGGGATDIRTFNGAWNDTTSLASRVIVAGAAGGWHNFDLKGGNGGTTNGKDSKDLSNTIYKGGSQTYGYKLGAGQSGASKTNEDNYGAEGNSGSGGGYYGGFSSQNKGSYSCAAGSGGSSFISGYKDLPVIDNIVFSHPSMIDGSISKHLGNGVVNITFLDFFSQNRIVVFKCYWLFAYICIATSY